MSAFVDRLRAAVVPILEELSALRPGEDAEMAARHQAERDALNETHANERDAIATRRAAEDAVGVEILNGLARIPV
ncbi:hypothetical protein [Prosthecomicrobium hirschii]|uniref:Uncharacterized protein n=1 Tax=Prosthecodimorpha hirschii TaxID=665126 RepID=A0A0P6VFE0_9HYPH|nr:hypothetical protein [Prosthecomicrobium hirschii]KPL50814.1 hypothetical protein ABB55_00020 [Prosthecomicrobium hirschii]MCW1839429.1 hypothetical protein [Prosthecomicrobium hirschii]MCW1844222.1 hypothetical protein [Prosthecomicrobium hirschii]